MLDSQNRDSLLDRPKAKRPLAWKNTAQDRDSGPFSPRPVPLRPLLEVWVSRSTALLDVSFTPGWRWPWLAPAPRPRFSPARRATPPGRRVPLVARFPWRTCRLRPLVPPSALGTVSLPQASASGRSVHNTGPWPFGSVGWVKCASDPNVPKSLS